MRLYIPDVLYRYLLENDADKWRAVERNYHIKGDPNFEYDDLSYGYPESCDDLKALEDNANKYFLKYINGLKLPAHLSILRDVRLNLRSDDSFFQDIERRIEALPAGYEKTMVLINYLKERIQNPEKSYVRQTAQIYRQRMVDAYNREVLKARMDEETLSLIHYTMTELHFAQHDITQMDPTVEYLKSIITDLEETLAPLESIMTRAYPTEYMTNIKSFERLYAYSKFYNTYVLKGNADTFVEMDELVSSIIDGIDFKYRDFNIFRIQFLLDRILAHFSHGHTSKGFILLNDFRVLLTRGLNERNLLSRSLQYRSRSDTKHFLALVASVIDYEAEYLNRCTKYPSKNQFTNLPFSGKEKRAMALARTKEQPMDWSIIERVTLDSVEK